MRTASRSFRRRAGVALVVASTGGVLTGGLMLGGLMLGGCAVDDRELDASGVSGASGGPSSGVNALNPGSQSADGQSGPAPVLAVMPVDLDLGAMLVGYPSIGVITIGNSGNATMDAPSVALSLATSSDFTILQNCEDSIDPGEVCSVRVQLVPHAVGNVSGSLQIASALAGSAAVSLHGSGLNANGDLIVGSADGSSFQFGETLLGQTQRETFTITNPDQSPSGAIGLTIANADFQLIAPSGNDCVPGVTSLPSGGSCTVQVSFTPSLRGLSQGALVITSSGAGNGVQALEGVGVAPASLQSSRSTLDFGGGILNQPTPAVVTLTNAGDRSVQFSSVTISGANADSFGVSNSACTGELKPGATCDITVQFQAATLGDLAASLDVQSNAPALSVPLTGTGLQSGSLVIAPVDGAAPAPGAPYDFGGVLVGSQSIKSFRVSNPSAATSGFLQDIHAGGDFALVPPADGECNATTSLANGESCNLKVAFSPTARDTRSGSLTVTSVAAGSQALPLTGKGTVAANLASSPNTVAFGDVVLGQVRSSVVTVSNGGDEITSVPNVAISGAGASAFSVTANGCTQGLGFGQTCQVTVQFAPTSPTNHVQLLSPSLQISATPGGSANVALSGRGLLPGSLQIAATGGSTAFQAASGSSQTLAFTVSNPGGTSSGPIALAIVNDQAGSLAFAFSGAGMPPCQNGVTTLDGGQSCGFNVTFTPPASGGAFSGSITVSSRSAGSSTLAVSGTGQSAPSLATAQGSSDFGQVNLGATSADFQWQITNSGGTTTPPLQLANSNPANFTIAQGTDCPLSSGMGLAPGLSCFIVVRFVPQAASLATGTLTLSAGSLAPLTLTVQGRGFQPIGRGAACNVGDQCAGGLVCGVSVNPTSGTGRVCCDQACTGVCQGCSVGGNGGVCGAVGSNTTCTNQGFAGLCTTTGTCTEFCVLDHSLLDACLMQ